MQIKYSILKQTSEGLVIDLYFSDWPEIGSYAKEVWYKEDLNHWLSHPDKTVKVDEGSIKKFKEFVFSKYIGLEDKDIPFEHIDEPLQKGIEIPPDVFEVKTICDDCGGTEETGNCDYPEEPKLCDFVELAFFKGEKEEAQDDLWGEIEKDLLDVDISSDESEKCLLRWKQNFEIKRRKG